MKFGVDIRHIEAITPLNFNGSDNYGTFHYETASFTGQEFADFLIGTPNTTFYDTVQSDNDGQSMHYHLYAQDQWKVSSRLTLSYGLRWEFILGIMILQAISATSTIGCEIGTRNLPGWEG